MKRISCYRFVAIQDLINMQSRPVHVRNDRVDTNNITRMRRISSYCNTARREENRKNETKAIQNVFSEKEEQSTTPELHEAKDDRSGVDTVEDVSWHKSSQTDMTMQFVSTMESELHTLSSDLIMAKSRLENSVYDEKYFEINEDKVKNYTGLPTYALLKEIYLYIESGMNQTVRSRLSKFQEMLLVLFKLKLSIPFQVLGDMFNIHQSTASNLFLKVLEVMYVNLSDLIHWPERDFIKETMPKEFIKEFGRKVTVIIDCFEIFIERPSSVKAQAQTYSSYKHHNTVKYLIGITPQGVVSFLSSGWGGRTSDKHVTEHCGFLDKLQYGDLILADRGFDISDSVALQCAEVRIPAFLKGKKQLPAIDTESTGRLAHLRIHVERIIGNTQQKFRILQDTAPIDFLMSREGSVPTLDKIVTICFSPVNLYPSVVPLT